MAEVIEVNDVHELAAHRLAAGALLDETPRASFFHTLDWLEAYWRHCGKGLKLRTLVVRAAGQTIGVVPFVVRWRPSPLGPLRVLTYPLSDGGGWCGPLGASRSAVLAMAFRHLQRTPRDWDLIDLPGIEHDGADRGRTLRAMHGVGWRASATPTGEASHIELGRGFDAYLADCRPEFRDELSQARQSAEAWGRVGFVRHRPAPFREGDGDPRWDWYDACEEITVASRDATPRGGARRALLRDAHAAASRRGAADLCLLTIDGRPAAFAYSYHHDGRVVTLKIDDAGDAPAGVRTALVARMIQDGCHRGDRLIELRAGDQPEAERLRTGGARDWRLRYAPLKSLRGSASVLGGQLRQRLVARVG